MRTYVERIAPRTPGWRMVLATVSTVVGLFGVAFALSSTYAPINLFLTGLPGMILLLASYFLIESVVRRANAAPEPDWWGPAETAEPGGQSIDDVDPVEKLKHRYAEGDLTTEEFEERIDRLVDHDGVARDETTRGERGRNPEREVERA